MQSTQRTEEQQALSTHESPPRRQQPPSSAADAAPDSDEDQEYDDSQPELESSDFPRLQMDHSLALPKPPVAHDPASEACASRWCVRKLRQAISLSSTPYIMEVQDPQINSTPWKLFSPLERHLESTGHVMNGLSCTEKSRKR